MTHILFLTEKVNMYWNSETIHQHILYSEAQTDQSMIVHLSFFLTQRHRMLNIQSSVDNNVDYNNVLSFIAVKISPKNIYIKWYITEV